MEAMEGAADDFGQQFSTLVGVLGGFAGIGTAVAAGAMWIYRSGVNHGRKIEREKQQAAELKAINKKLRGRK